MSNPQNKTLPMVNVPEKRFSSFLNVPVDTNLERLQADVAIVGIPYGIPYGMGQMRSASAPGYIREKSLRFLRSMKACHNFDSKKLPLNLSEIRIVDCGDVPMDPMDIQRGVQRASEVIHKILERKAIPIVFGGDDAIPIPVIRAYKNKKPIVVIQIDEHLDFADEINGVREGYSNPMRRVSEMDWVKQIIQVGLHGYGPAEHFEAATKAGNTLITEEEVHKQGIENILDKIPGNEDYFITVDFDGLDPSICPAVSHPEPGGLTFSETRDFLGGLAKKGRIVGMDFVELVPDHDLNGLSGHTTGRLIIDLLHAMIESEHFAKGSM